MAEQPLPKSQWGPGPWQDEPDTLDWRDEATGLPCRIRRNAFAGQLNGYVGVPPGHALFGWDRNDPILAKDELVGGQFNINDVGVLDLFVHAFGGDSHGTVPLCLVLRVHSGVTWSGAMPDESETRHHWFGFDCGHSGDYMPALEAELRMVLPHSEFREHQRLLGLGAPMPWGGKVAYRDLAYVKNECAVLARQLKALEAITIHAPDVAAMVVKEKK